MLDVIVTMTGVMVIREWLSSCPRRVVMGAGCDSYDDCCDGDDGSVDVVVKLNVLVVVIVLLC